MEISSAGLWSKDESAKDELQELTAESQLPVDDFLMLLVRIFFTSDNAGMAMLLIFWSRISIKLGCSWTLLLIKWKWLGNNGRILWQPVISWLFRLCLISNASLGSLCIFLLRSNATNEDGRTVLAARLIPLWSAAVSILKKNSPSVNFGFREIYKRISKHSLCWQSGVAGFLILMSYDKFRSCAVVSKKTCVLLLQQVVVIQQTTASHWNNKRFLYLSNILTILILRV